MTTPHQQGPSGQQVTARDYLYTNGYIACMLGAEQAPRYITHLLQVDEHHIQLVVLNGVFWLLHPAVQSVPPATHIGNQPAWPLDYVLRAIGTVVPQRLYIPTATSDAQRYGTVPLNMPIFFVQRDHVTLGLPLNQAAAGNCTALLNAHLPAPIGRCHTTFIRILWRGYNEWNSQIMTRDQTPAHNIIPLEALAARVARAVCRFIQDASGQQCMSPDWRVGRGGITTNDIILIGLIHVTQGTWQPILQLNRFIISPPSNVRRLR